MAIYNKYPKPLKSYLGEMIHDDKWGPRLRRGIVLRTAPPIINKVMGRKMGEHIDHYELAGRMKDQLLIHAVGGAARTELHAQREAIRRAINQRVGTTILQRVSVKQQ